MKDPRDSATADMLPAPKKRGRKPTGKALSPAEKQERYRNRKAAQMIGIAVALRQFSEYLTAPTPDLVERVQEGLLDLAEQLDPRPGFPDAMGPTLPHPPKTDPFED
ncbi:hypothetical protein D3C84_324750 [compost metagenome]